MVSLRHHGGNLARNGLVLVKAHIPLSLKPPEGEQKEMVKAHIPLIFEPAKKKGRS